MAAHISAQKGASLLSQGEKALKTSWSKWKPDYLNAAPLFEKAGVSFRAAREFERARDAFERASEAHYEIDAVFASGQMLEKAAASLEQVPGKKRADDACIYLERAANRFVEAGEPATAATCLRKAAESYKKRGDPGSRAAPLFLRACEVLEETGKAILGVDTFRATLNFLVSEQKWTDALDFCHRMIKLYEEIKQPSNVFKMYLSIVVLNLCRNDYVAAKAELDKHFDNAKYLTSAECEAAEDILIAWKEGDDLAVENILKTKLAFQYLDREIGKVARKLNPRRSVAPIKAGRKSPASLRSVDPMDGIQSAMSSLDVAASSTMSAASGKAALFQRSGKPAGAAAASSKAALFQRSAKPPAAPVDVAVVEESVVVSDNAAAEAA